MMNFTDDSARDYANDLKNLAYVTATQDQFEDCNDNDRRLLQQGLVGVHKGNSPEIRRLFNSKFNQLVLYHSRLWRELPAEMRNRDYYDSRYARFFEDFFRLCEKFPDIQELNHDYKVAIIHCTAYEDAYDKRHSPSEEFYRNSRPWRFFA